MKKVKVIVFLVLFLSGSLCFGMVYPVGDPNIKPTSNFESGNGYVVTQSFLENNGSEIFHLGVDLATYNNASGGDVRSIADGVVSKVQISQLTTGWGTLVRVRHRLHDGTVYYSQYAHMLHDSVVVAEDDAVSEGQVIGKVGSTGFSTAPHLHFEVKKKDQNGCGYFPSENCSDDSIDNYYNPLRFIEDHQVSFTPSFNYPDFSSVDGIDFFGSAVPDFEVPAIQLTDETNSQVGSFYFREPQYIKDGFEMTAMVWISRNRGDGFAFVILNQYNIVLGADGGGLGYQNIPGSAAVELDNWQNRAGDPEFGQTEEPGIHVGFHTLGAVEENSAAPHAAYPDLASAETRNIPSLFDAKIHNLKIRYLSEVLSIYIDDMAVPVLEVPVNLADVLKLPGGLAWVGFTGATGGATQIQDILRWSFAVNDKSLRPDLTAEIQVVPSDLYVGELAEVNFTVLNNSDFPAETSQATVNFGSQSEVVAVPALAVGEIFSSNVKFNLITEGQHIAEVIADSANVVTESDEGNNTASVEVTVLLPRPDLSIGQVNFSSEVKGKNAEISADVWIHNTGNADTEAFSATVKIVETGGLYSARFDSLAAGQSEVISISDFLKKVGDKVTLEVTVDDENEIVEIEEFNNEVEYSYAL